jgi:hypothetical protein
MSNLIDDVLANPLVGATASALAIAGVALWIAAAFWAWRDAARRSESTAVAFVASAWIIVSTPMLLPLSLLIYLVARPQTSAAEHRAESLIAALNANTVAGSMCAGCEARIDAAWLRCPRCATWLSAPCASCGEWSPADLEICPYCAHEGHALPIVEGAAADVPAAAFAGLRRARRAARPRIGRRAQPVVADRQIIDHRAAAARIAAAIPRHSGAQP